MSKEKLPVFESGYSEKEMDMSVDKTKNMNQVKPTRYASASIAGGAVNIFVSKNKKTKKNST